MTDHDDRRTEGQIGNAARPTHAHLRRARDVERDRFTAERPDRHRVAVDAVDDVVVDWEPLPAVSDPFAAMAEGAPRLHEDAPGNIEHQNTIKAGDPDGVFAKARRVVKQRMVSQRLCGVPLEGRATLAAPDPTSGGLVVWATNQAPHGLRNDLATALSMPQNLIRVIAPEVGGGFGVKFGCYPEDAVVAALARLYRMPLRWTETRVEHMMATTHGRAQVADLEAAVEDDGTIAALRMRVTADIGAYPVFTFIPDLTLMMGIGVYKIANVDLQSTCVFTNSTSVAAYRGAGRPEATFVMERLVDMAAQKLGLDPKAVNVAADGPLQAKGRMLLLNVTLVCWES
jgi:carbon-monoxide dehydrogenase large subunit